MPQRVYLDDLRRAPHGWIQTQTAEETIALLKEGDVVELSLDYNLGPATTQTGAAVLLLHHERKSQQGRSSRIPSGNCRR